MRPAQSLLFLSLIMAGCGLFKSEPGSSGANAPVMYGVAPVAGAPGTALDAAAPAVADGSAPVDVTPDATPNSANGAQLWTRFPPASYSFTKCTWLSRVEGYCNDAPSLLPGTARVAVTLYKTLDAGKSWTLVCSIDTEMPDLSASIDVVVLSQTDLWFVAGSTKGGNIGHSADGGKHWISLGNDLSTLLSPPASGGVVASLPFWQLVAQAGRIWVLAQGANLAYSPDDGVTWKKLTPPADFGSSGKRSLVVTQNNLLLQYLASDGSLGLYRWNGSAFLPTEATLPVSSAGSHLGTWSRAWPAVEAVFFADRGPLPAWGAPFWAYATLDAGKTLLKLLPGPSGGSEILGLSDGLAFPAHGSLTAYVSGIFSDGAAGRLLEVRRTQDAGKTWTTLHSQPSYPGDASYISLSLDSAGYVHAMHFLSSTDGIGPPVVYDGHYVLP